MEITFGDNVKAADDFTGTGWYSKQPEGLLYLDNWLIGYKGDEPTGDIIIADGTTHINGFALSNCKSITSVTIPKSVIYIGDLFLRNCDAIVGLNVDNGNIVFDSRENCNAIIETNSNTIIKACINTIIPQTVTQIGMCSFEELDFVEINIPGNVVEISEGAFSYCKKLRRVTIGNGVTSIGDYAFNGCSVLENLELGNKVEVIGERAFQDCSNLENVKLPNSLLRIKQYAFNSTKWYNNQTESPYVLDGWILYDTGSPYLKEGIRGIADRVYSNNIGYSGTLKIPSTVVGIGEFAFSSCRGLYGVIIPNSVRHIASGAFYYTNISSVSLPQGIKCISSSTFQHCENLRKVVIPQSVTNIETGAFYFSSRIEDLYLLAKTPPVVSEEGLSVFDTGIYNEATLYVPIGSKELYQSSPVWKEFKQIVEIETEYNISYVIDGEVVASEILTLGEIITPPTDIPQKKGYKFSWENLPETMPAKDIIINGLYTPKTYYIRYEVDNKLYRSVGVNYGDSIKLIDEPTKKGHTFSGWSEIPETMPAEDITVSGTFTANDYVVTYIVDGEVYKTDSVTYGTEIVLIDEPVKEGHTFSGWGEKPSIMPAESITISGYFTVNSYSVIFAIDGKIYESMTVEFGAEIPTVETPVKEGHTFSGWSEIPSTMPAEDIVINGSFIVNRYTVTFVVDGEVYKSAEIEYGAEIPIIEAPSKNGRKFSGWSEIPSTMPAENVIVEGKFCYTIIFMVDGKYYHSSEIYYGNDIKAPLEVPQKVGHTFVDWGDLPETMPARDMTIHAVFSVNEYQLIFIIDGEVYETLYIEYGSKIEYPQIEGYVITWETDDLPETMPAENLIIIGTSTLDTAIKGIHEVHSDYIIYTLDGHRVLDIENLRSGFYIINGKKVFVK
jgi:hypothetical protein